ncbi:MAG: hypothetical protein ACLUFN_03525 [Eubacterium sp.]
MIDSKAIDNIFTEFGCVKKKLPNKSVCYFKEDIHFKFTFVEGINSYVLETAGNHNEAVKNLFEDNETYFADADDETIIENLKNDLKNLYNLKFV